MENARRTVLLTGLAIIVGSAVVGYGLGTFVENLAGPGSTPATASASPTATEEFSPTSIQVPIVTPASGSKPAETAPVPVRIVIESAPERVARGVSFTVRWRLDGPRGLTDTSTRLVVKPERLPQILGPARSHLPLPATVEATVTAQPAGILAITVEAVVQGLIYTADRNIHVE